MYLYRRDTATSSLAFPQQTSSSTTADAAAPTGTGDPLDPNADVSSWQLFLALGVVVVAIIAVIMITMYVWNKRRGGPDANKNKTRPADGEPLPAYTNHREGEVPPPYGAAGEDGVQPPEYAGRVAGEERGIELRPVAVAEVREQVGC